MAKLAQYKGWITAAADVLLAVAAFSVGDVNAAFALIASGAVAAGLHLTLPTVQAE